MHGGPCLRRPPRRGATNPGKGKGPPPDNGDDGDDENGDGDGDGDGGGGRGEGSRSSSEAATAAARGREGGRRKEGERKGPLPPRAWGPRGGAEGGQIVPPPVGIQPGTTNPSSTG